MTDAHTNPFFEDVINITLKTNTTIAYTDGACKGNPGQGGWGVLLVLSDGKQRQYYGGDNPTTNNRMEMMAAIKAIQLSPSEHDIELWTDSSYLKQGITTWIHGWKKRHWKKADGKPVLNQDLWQQLDALCEQDKQQHKRQIHWHWVKGHAGHAGNEMADKLANLGVQCPTGNTGNTGNNDVEKKSDVKKSDVKKAQNHLAQQRQTHVTNHTINHANPTMNHSTDDWLHIDPLGLDTLNLDALNLDALSFDDPSFDGLNNDTNHMPNTQTNAQPNIQANMNMPQDMPAMTFNGDTSRANPSFCPLLPPPINRGQSERQLIMDTETTGMNFTDDRIVEVGIIELIGRKPTGEKLHVYINPQMQMSEEVIKIHGISNAFVADMPTFDKVAQPIYDFMIGAEVIAHNADFDMNFLTAEFNRVGLTDFAKRVTITDSLAIAKQLYPGQKNSLDALVKRLNVGKQDRTFHGALLDSEILAEVYLALTGGQVSLAIDDALPNQGGQPHAQFTKLANLLIKDNHDDTAHKDWINALKTQYPDVVAPWS